MKKENITTRNLVNASTIEPKVFDKDLFVWIRKNFIPAEEPYYAMNSLDFWRAYNYERKEKNLPTISKWRFLIAMDMRDYTPINGAANWIFYISEESPAIEKVKVMYAEMGRRIPYRYVPSKPLYKLTAEKIVKLLEAAEDHTIPAFELRAYLDCGEKTWATASKYLKTQNKIEKENVQGVWYWKLLK